VTVVDASIAVKWLIPEPGSEEAQRLLDSGENLAAPGLIAVEVAAALARKARTNEIPAQSAESALEIWLQSLADGLVNLMSDDNDLRRAFKLAAAIGHPLQDCLYLALSERLGARLATADARFALKARGVSAGVYLLATEPNA